MQSKICFRKGYWPFTRVLSQPGRCPLSRTQAAAALMSAVLKLSTGRRQTTTTCAHPPSSGQWRLGNGESRTLRMTGTLGVSAPSCYLHSFPCAHSKRETTMHSANLGLAVLASDPTTWSFIHSYFNYE